MNRIKQLAAWSKHTHIISDVFIILCVVAIQMVVQNAVNKEPSNAKPIDIKVAVIGDSITEGNVDGKKESYPDQLQMLLGDSYEVINYGQSGTTLLSTGDSPYEKKDFYRESKDINPDIVVIMLGTNDSKLINWNASLYEEELVSFVNGYKNLAKHPKIYLLTSPVAHDKKEAAIDTDINGTVVDSEVAPITRRVAKVTGVSLIDIHAATKDHLDLFPDGVHPSPAGSRLMAETIYNAMK